MKFRHLVLLEVLAVAVVMRHVPQRHLPRLRLTPPTNPPECHVAVERAAHAAPEVRRAGEQPRRRVLIGT